MFSTPRHTLQICDEDCVFCLMFDEMSVREKLCFIHKFSCMEGFEDLGNHGRTSNIANHAKKSLCCMVCITSGSN